MKMSWLIVAVAFLGDAYAAKDEYALGHRSCRVHLRLSADNALGKRFAVECNELCDSTRGEVDEARQLLARERFASGSALPLDEIARARHPHVHVGAAARVLGIVGAEHRPPADDAHRDGGDEIAQR